FAYAKRESVKIPYRTLKAQATQGNVARISSRGDRIAGKFTRPITSPDKTDSTTNRQPRTIAQFTTTIPAFADPGLDSVLVAHGTEINAEPVQGSAWFSLLLGFAPSWLLIVLYVWLFRRAAKQGGLGGGGGVFGLGLSNARRFDKEPDARVT